MTQPTTDAIIRNLAMQILIAQGHLPPSPNHALYDRLMARWLERYEQARATAGQMLAATGETHEH